MTHLLATTFPSLVGDLLLTLLTAAIVVLLASRLRIAAIPAYLIAGILIGPGVFGLVTDADAIDQIGSMALIFLMFSIGLEMDLHAFRGALVPMVAVGIGSTMLSAIVAWGLLAATGVEPITALVIGMAMSMSSTAVVLRLIQQRREGRTTFGRLTLAVLVVQDLMVVVMLAAIPPLARLAHADEPGAEAATVGALLRDGAIAVGGVAALAAVGRLALPRILAEAARGKSSDVMLVLCAAVALCSAAATSALGFSPEMGAFIAGFLLSTTPFRYHIAGLLLPLRDLLMAVFFTSIGFSVMPGSVVSMWWALPVGLLALVAIKAAGISLCAWAAGATGGMAVRAGASLAQAGEFSLVVLAVGVAAGIVGDGQNAVAVGVIVLSLIVTPALMDIGAWASRRISPVSIAPWLKQATIFERPRHAGPAAQHAKPDDRPGVPRHVVIAGFGPVGRAAADRFARLGVPVTIIEMNPKTVKRQQGLGKSIVFGDATNPEVLASAGVADADAVIFTMPDDDAVIRACRAARALAPDAAVVGRASFLSKAALARAHGADHVVVEEMATAETMEREVFEALERKRRMMAPAGDEPVAAEAAR